MEKLALFINLKNTLLEKASKVATLWIAFIDGVSPTVVALSATTPFLLSHANLIGFEVAFYASVTIILATLFILGAFLGKISGLTSPREILILDENRAWVSDLFDKFISTDMICMKM